MIKKTWFKWADRLYNWQLNEVVASLLEAAGPLTLLGAQAIYFGQPLLSVFAAKENTQALAELLESPTQQQAFIEVLRSYPLKNDSGGYSL
ncbi:MAG: hypothetical protein MAG431_00501 [Chloroflexi bacterium]|nr:hypothetical protein [Chloroflexota bacterium]